MVGLHDLFSADRAPTLGLGEGFRQRVTVGRRRNPTRQNPTSEEQSAPPTGPRLLKREAAHSLERVLPKFKLRLMLAAHISSCCCTKVSHTRSCCRDVAPKCHI